MLTAVRFAVRPMAPVDIPQVVDIERESFPFMWPQTTYKRELQNRLARYLVLVERTTEPTPSPPSPEEAPRGWRETLRRLFGHDSSPAPTPELIVGFVGIWMLADEAHVVTIAVRDSHRRRGVGELLLIAAIETALRERQSVVTLECRVSNAAALRLYGKYGFEKVGLRRSYYSDNQEDAYILTADGIGTPSYGRRFQRLRDEHRERWGEYEPSL